MRITHVITRLIVGGAQENTIQSVLGLRRIHGPDVRLISGPTSGPEGSLESAFDSCLDALTILPSLVRPIHPWKDLLAWRQLRSIFQRERPDIVHTHSGKAGILGRLAAHRAEVPLIVHSIHGPSFGPFQGRLPNLIFRSAERAAGAVTTHFVSVADAMTRQYLAEGIGHPKQYTRLWSGFDLHPFLTAPNDPAVRARYGIGTEDIVVGKIARLFKLKGHDDLFAVAARLVAGCPRIKFLLVGDGAWRGRFEEMARSSGLQDHFIFAGLVPPAAVPRLVGIMDLLVHLSQREGLARALPQALAAGKPVLAYDCDGAKEICIDNQTGFLVQPGDLPSLTDRVLLLAGDAELRRKLGSRGQEFVRRNFSVETMVNDLEALYQRLWKTARPERLKN